MTRRAGPASALFSGAARGARRPCTWSLTWCTSMCFHHGPALCWAAASDGGPSYLRRSILAGAHLPHRRGRGSVEGHPSARDRGIISKRLDSINQPGSGRDVIAGGARAGVSRSQLAGQGHPGGVQVRHHRVEPETLLVGGGCTLLEIGIRSHQGAVKYRSRRTRDPSPRPTSSGAPRPGLWRRVREFDRRLLPMSATW